MGIDVEDITPRIQYVAAVGQTEFDYPFAIFAEGDLVVSVDGAPQSLETNYTVTLGEDDPGVITFVEAMAGGEIVTIVRDTAIERVTDAQQNGPWTSAGFNDELDKAYVIMQEQEARVGRALRIPMTAEVDSSDIELDPANYANKYLTFDADGKPTPAELTESGAVTQAIVGAALYPRTAAELAAGITPTAYQYPEGDSRRLNVVGDGIADDTTALTNLLAVGAESGRPVTIYGTPRITSTLTVPDGVTIIFAGAPGNFSGQRPTSYIVKDNAMTTAGLLISGQSVKLVNGGVIGETGNTGDNIHITGHSCRWEHAYSEGAGQDGIRIGENASGVPNSNHFVLIAPCCADNGRDGIHIDDALPGPNANAGMIQAPFVSSNGRYGLYGNNSFSNTIIGILAEANDEEGVFLDELAVSWLFFGGDIEANTAGAGTPGSDLTLATSIQGAGGQKGHNLFFGVNVGTPPDDSGYCTGRGWLGFPAFGSVSGPGDVNAEGTCTLTFAGTSTAGTNTYSQQSGRWTKNGRQVTVHFDLEVSGNSVAMVGNLRISGLPFSGLSSTGGLAQSLVSLITFPSANYTALGGAMNGTNFDLYAYGSAQAISAIPVANLDASAGRLAGVITYMTPDD